MDKFIKEIAPDVRSALESNGTVVLTAPPGTGKSTLLPLKLLEYTKGRILMLEPRRLAARQIAERMSFLLGEPVGQTVGYRVRFESKVSGNTRLEVLTEGILARRLISDPTLEDVDLVIFDEFHERSIVCDQALALTLESRKLIRQDLRIVIMSATMDTSQVCERIGAAKVEYKGIQFPVKIINTTSDTTEISLITDTARAIAKAWREQEGDILAFLPGEGEIRRCTELTEGKFENTVIHPLYGMLNSAEQKAALMPDPQGYRKIVLATPVAETSVTIEGIRTVIDCGFHKKPIFDTRSSMSRLETVRISLDMARQRSGRAGRTAPGVCYRLWTTNTEARMAENRKPEILEADLAPLLLDTAAWGERNIYNLPWLTVPPSQEVKSAASLLESLGATGPDGAITAFGKSMSALPCHPRISSMLLNAGNGQAWNGQVGNGQAWNGQVGNGQVGNGQVGNGQAWSGSDKWHFAHNAGNSTMVALAADIAALMEEKDPMPQEDADICKRIDRLRAERSGGTKANQDTERSGGAKANQDTERSGGTKANQDTERSGGKLSGTWLRIARIAEQYRRMARAEEDNTPADAHCAGMLIASAYPERIAMASDAGNGHFILSNGDRAFLPRTDDMAAFDWIAVASLNSRENGEGRIFLAAPLNTDSLRRMATEKEKFGWDPAAGKVVARKEWRIGKLLLESKQISSVPKEQYVEAVCEAAGKEGHTMFNFDEKVRNLQHRIALASVWHPELNLPDMSDAALLARASEWIPLFAQDAQTVQELRKTDLCQVILSLVPYEVLEELEKIVPETIKAPTGSNIRIEYRGGAEAPVMRVRLQECFGMTETPRVDKGTRPVLMELLSPGFKPVQLTSDLENFWSSTYFEVRKELKRRYPRHSWPDNPTEAPAVRGIRKG